MGHLASEPQPIVRESDMTMIEPGLNTKASPYEPMKSLRAWREASADTLHPGSNRYVEERNARAKRENVLLRMELIREEFKEVTDELLDFVNGDGDRVKLAKELADLLYVTYGAADAFDIPLQEVFDAVHVSNMTKVAADGKVQRRDDGKILKGPHYQEPDVMAIVLGDVSSVSL